MDRRKFIKRSAPIGAAPFLLNSIPFSTFATPKMISSFNCDISDRVLVVVFLVGGNDGLNTMVPLDQYQAYRNYRPTIYIPDSGSNKYIDLDNTLNANQLTGLHPQMTGAKSMYDLGNMHIVQAVGYPNANKSHFKSTDLWFTGGDGGSGSSLKSGQFGRFLDNNYPNLVGNPSQSNPDPLGIQLGDSTMSLGYLTAANQVAAANLTDQDPSGFFSVVQDIGTSAHSNIPPGDYGSEIQYIMDVEHDTSIYAQRISSVFSSGSNSAVTYPDSYLGYQLKTVARMLAGGSKTKVFLVHRYGFDTHDNQIQSIGNPNIGWHAELMADIFDSIKAFHDDLGNLGLSQNVVSVTMSEFGRKIIENAALGTDHGTLAPMFLFGDPVAGGMTGHNMDMDDQDNQGAPDNSQLQYDYRQIFTSLYQDWLGASDSVLNSTFSQLYEKLPVIDDEFVVDPTCYGAALPIELLSFRAKKAAEKVTEIQWISLSEVDHDYFLVQRSNDAVHFDNIKRVKGKGGKDKKAEYVFFDDKPRNGINYYRLKSVDLNGDVQYSSIESVEYRSRIVKSFRTFPNPANIEAYAALNAERAYNAKFEIIDMEGHVLMQSNFYIEKGYQKVPLNIDDLSSGIYIVRIIGQREEIAQTKLIVSK